MTEEELIGVKAIQKLQGVMDIEEPTEKALAGWRSMSKHEQEFTLKFANFDDDTLDKFKTLYQEMQDA